jgi:transglutaminase-like putative cysteine protease
VDPVEPGELTPAQRTAATSGEAYALVDLQVLSTPRERVSYTHYVTRAINASGVASATNIEIGFDPSWQRLVIHSVDVVRDGAVIHKLGGARIQVIQRESEREAQIYDERKAASILLEDVRVGDVVDFAFSTIGRNPVFDGVEFGAFDLQFADPVARIYARLVVPASSTLVPTGYRTNIRPQVSLRNGMREFTWDLHAVPDLRIDEGAPGWHVPRPAAEWSGFADWKAVADWAIPLYAPPAVLGPEVDAVVARLRREQATPAGRLLAALRYVQREIRYLGVETGRGSHAPNPPALVLRRRFGDCKDKVLLMLALLDRLGVEAHATLVNTGQRRNIAEHAPTPVAFDHVLVQAIVGGRTYWLDPTRSTQEASLAALYQPDFDLGLVVAPGTRALSSMRPSVAPPPLRTIASTFDARGGFDKPVDFRVTTVYRGLAAESQRETLAGNTLDAILKQYLQFYAASFPGIRAAEDLSVEDDRLGNRVTVREHYTIADAASAGTQKGRQAFAIATPDIDDLLAQPKTPLRTAPLGLNHPFEVVERTEVLLSEPWPVTPVDTRIDDPAFAYHRTVAAVGNSVVIEDHFKTLADAVPAADMRRYAANLGKARDALGYELYWDAGTPATGPLAERINWAVVLVALLAAGLWTVAALRVSRFDPPPRRGAPGAPAGLGGWLVLLGFGLVASALVSAGALVDTFGNLTPDAWGLHAVPGGANFDARWAPLVLMEVIAQVGRLVFVLLATVLFFQRRSSFPRVVFVLYAACVLATALDIGASGLIGITASTETIAELVRAIFATLVWGSYVLVSKRVKATFVRRRRGQHDGAKTGAWSPVPDLPVALPVADEARLPA